MAKRQINKKFLVILLVLIVVVAGGVGLFILLKPKADLKAPYNNTYALVNNQDYKYVKQRNYKIELLLEQTLTSIQDENYNLTKHTFNVLNNINTLLTSQNEVLLENLLFAKDHNGKMVDVQKNLTKAYENVLQQLDVCKAHLTYLTDAEIANYSLDTLWQKIYNYKALYVNYIDAVTDFYSFAGDIFENYLYNTIDVNPLVKQNIQTIVKWSNSLADCFINYSQENSLESLNQSYVNLFNFAETYKNVKGVSYFSNITAYNELLSNFNNVDFNTCINHLSLNSYPNFVDNLLGPEKASAITLGKNYFGVIGG